MCYSPLVAAERSRKRNALRERTEADAEALGDREAEGAPDLSLAGAPRAGAPVRVPDGVLPGMAPAAAAGPDAVREEASPSAANATPSLAPA